MCDEFIRVSQTTFLQAPNKKKVLILMNLLTFLNLYHPPLIFPHSTHTQAPKHLSASICCTSTGVFNSLIASDQGRLLPRRALIWRGVTGRGSSRAGRVLTATMTFRCSSTFALTINGQVPPPARPITGRLNNPTPFFSLLRKVDNRQTVKTAT